MTSVLILINGLGTGGAERSTAELLPYLVEDGFEPTVFCLHRRDEGVQDELVRAGYDIQFATSTGLGGRVAEVRRLIRDRGARLVHTAIYEADAVGRLAALGGPPVLTSLVNVAYDPSRLADPNVSRPRLEVARAIERVTGRLTAHFHAITHAVKDSAVRNLGIPPSAITVVERGRDPGRLGARTAARRHRVREQLGIGRDVPVLLVVGRQEYQKGQVHLIEALAHLRRAHPQVTLLLAGRKGHASSAISAAVDRHDLGQHVVELGHRDDVPDLMVAADLFVFPSMYEGLGGSLLEAMALGTPSVVSDIPPLREVVGASGAASFVAPGQPAELADAIVDLLQNPDRRTAMGEAAGARFESTYTWSATAPRMVDLYRTVSGGGR